MSELIQHFITQLYKTQLLEWMGVITGFLCIYLAAKNHILNWPISVISIVCYIILFYESQLYGEIVLQMYFLFTAIYGWYYWRKKTDSQNQRAVVRLKKSLYVYVLLTVLLGTLIFYFVLRKFTDTNVPLTDAFCTSMSFVAQYLLTRKIIQNWILWIIVDFVYVPLFIYKELYLSSLLYFTLMILAYAGYSDWQKLARSNQSVIVT